MDSGKAGGLKRIRLVASIIAAVMFAATAIEQFRGQDPAMRTIGIIVSTAAGFLFVWIVMTMVMLVFKLFRRKGK